MESNIADQQLWSPDSPLAEPHFDEEATLLSARPVVPIKELTAKAGFSRPWLFGLALAGALLLGVSATAFYYSLFETTGPESGTTIETISSGVQGVASEPPALNEYPETRPTEAGSSPTDSNKSAKVKTQAATVSSSTRLPKSSPPVSQKPAPRRERAMIDESAEAEYETRDVRRAARRDAKERKRADRERRIGRRDDGVLRIRDIFEGPARP